MSLQHPSLRRAASALVAGRWEPIAGEQLVSTNPARPAEVVWAGAPRPEHTEEAAQAARAALPEWSAWPPERRFDVLRRFAEVCTARQADIAALIRDETGKVQWDAVGEAQALAAKVQITLEDSAQGSLRRVSGFEFALTPTRLGRCWFRPHGVMAVIAPFNFPMHLANGHIVPALAMGNTIVLKPSDKAPACGQLLVELLDEALSAAGAPAGVVNLVQGGADAARALVSHKGVDGVLFTGSWPVGRKILEANLDTPSRIVALEMGGNNAAVVMDDADLRTAAVECVRSAFATTGQRCTCTRRLVVHEAVADRFIPAVCKAASNLIVGDPRSPHPVFMGPIISRQACDAVLAFQSDGASRGGRMLLEATTPDLPGGGWYITPGVMEVNAFSIEVNDAGCDTEVFGPLLRVCTVGSLDDAIEQANATRFGLAASIFTKDAAAAERFLRGVKAGCLNVNTGTAGASSRLPFGGLGLSGNHRPAGSFALDYCAYPVAGMIESGAEPARPPTGMRFEEEWLR